MSNENVIDDGGQAFPQMSAEWDDARHEYVLGRSLAGMSLRDYFAAKAMNGILSNFRFIQEAAEASPDVEGSHLVPKMAYEIADAMLAERAKS